MTRVGSAVDYYKYLFNPNYERSQPKQRVVLMTSENGLISILADKKAQVEKWNSQSVIITGNYDSCTQTIRPNTSNSIEPLL